MSNAAKLKKKAIELEQKKQFDKALAMYVQFLQESEGSLDDADISLYNRVGDLMLRTGSSSDALAYFEKAVDLYADRGFHNNAIALCNRVLRQAPGRASIYYKLGKISATKGFKSDAKKNFLEYADRMQKAGQIDEAFRALKEFADLCPDQDDIRLMLAEQLTKENRQDEAMEQLQKLHDKLDSEGRMAEARATVDRMKSIDPEAVPRKSGSYRTQKSPDLIFLDTSYEDSARPAKSPPTPARSAPPAPATAAKVAPQVPTPAAAAAPPGRQVSDPELVLLTLDDHADASMPKPDAALADALELEAPNDESPGAIPLLDIGQELPSADDIGGFDVDAMVITGQHVSSEPLDFALAAEPAAAIATNDAVALDISQPTQELAVPEPEPARAEFTAETSAYAAGPSLAVDYGDLAADFTAPPEPDGGDLFDFRSPPRSDSEAMDTAPLLSLDNDVSFPSFDLGDMSLPSADDVTSGGDLASALGVDASLTGGLDVLDLDAAGGSANDLMFAESEPDGSMGVAPSGGNDRLDFDLHGAESLATDVDESVSSTIAASSEDMLISGPAGPSAEVVESVTPPIAARVADPALVVASVADNTPPADAPIELPIDELIEAPAPVERAPTPVVSAAIRPARTADAEVATMPSAEPRHSPPPAAPDASAEPEQPGEQRPEWETQREQAERMLEAGDRANGVHKLEQVAAELERIGDLERALTIIDELIRLTPDSTRHHQKRVELAFRSNDRSKLIDAYLELGDALFRSGEERKARAVYQRVLELAPEDERARAAVDSVSSMSPPRGSGAIAAIPAAAPPPEVRPPDVPPTPARDSHRAPMPTPSNGARASNGNGAAAHSHKPAPLDRSAATNGDFIDLGDWLRSGESPKSTRMVADEKPPTGDEQADFQEMLKRFKQGVADNVDEEDFESHYDLGVAYKEMGLIDEAVAEFQKALRGHSNRVRTYEALGQCFIEKDQYQVAASVLSRAIAIGQGDDHHLVGVLYLLGRATEALSRNRDALDYYQRVFAVDIEFRDVADRIRAIERKAT